MTNFYKISGKITKNIALSKYENCQAILSSYKIFESVIKLVEYKLDDKTEEEVVVFDFHIDKHQNLIHDIKEVERIAISFKSDKELPRVFALRKDFPSNLSHLNSPNPNLPRELCLYEESWSELKHKWSAPTFLLEIREWLELSAVNKLHLEDQPLEPFLSTRFTLVFDPKHNVPFLFVKKIGDNIYETTTKYHKDYPPYLAVINSVEIEHGLIRDEPFSVGDLSSLPDISLNIIEPIHNYIDSILVDNAIDKQLLERYRVILILWVNLKRISTEKVESTRLYGFTLENTLASIGKKSGYMVDNPVDKDQLIKLELIGHKNNHSVDTIKDICIQSFHVIRKFDINLANSLSGINHNESIFSLVGCGSLGSQLLLNMARQAFGKWNLIDDDILLPHNLARHILLKKQIAQSKVTSIKHFVNQELFDNEDFILNCFEGKIESAESDVNLHQSLDDSDIIIDISTSISAQRFLTNTYPQKRKFSSFLNPKGSDLVFFAEDKKSQTSLNLLEYQYYKELLNNENLKNHLALNESRVRYARGCRDISSTIAQDNLAIFSGILSKKVKSQNESQNANISIWQLNENLSIKAHDFDIDEWEEIRIDDWTLYLNGRLLNEMRNFRKERLPNETGGIILGGVDKFYKKIFLTNSILSPIDSIEKRTLYIRGIKGVYERLNEIQRITNDSIYYLGEWHSHPKGCSVNMSSDDEKLFGELVNESLYRGEPTCMVIVGDKKLNLIISFTALGGKQNETFRKKIIL